MDDRDLNFSKSDDDEQSEMSNHDYDQDVKPVRRPRAIQSYAQLRFDDFFRSRQSIVIADRDNLSILIRCVHCLKRRPTILIKH